MADQSASSAEARHLAELIGLLRGDLAEFRNEMREGLGKRVTHAEVSGFMQLVDEKLAGLEARVRAVEEDAAEMRQSQKEESKLRKAALYTGSAGLGVAAATGLGGPLLETLG